jgi:hypothetical protein
MVGAAQLSGYLLEEVIAHLLRSSGYRPLQAGDDPDSLVAASNGLRVRGRGAEHQADSLGDLQVSIPFSLPIRLFVEAKNLTTKVGLDVVRNAHGVLHDVNEYVRGSSGSATRPRQVQYRYSVFSAGGFTREAQNFAYAHQISLIDLSGPSWRGLHRLVRALANEAIQIPVPKGVSVSAVSRRALRDALDRSDPDAETERLSVDAMNPWFEDWARSAARRVVYSPAGEDDLFLGFVDAPFILGLRPDDTDRFRRFLAVQTRPIPVSFHFDESGPLGGDWVMEPVNSPGAFRLKFSLPGMLEERIFGNTSDELRRSALAAKRELLQTVTIYVEGQPVRFQYERSESPPGGAVPQDASEKTALRQRFLRRVERPDEAVLVDGGNTGRRSPWSADAVEALLDRLEQGGYVQAELIRRAAHSGGRIAREEIYDLAGFETERTLRGLARPANRIRRELIRSGQLGATAQLAFAAVYEHGVTATSYEVPPEFEEIIAR